MSAHGFAEVNPLRDALTKWRALSGVTQCNPTALTNAGNELASMCDGLVYEFVELGALLADAETELTQVGAELKQARAECDTLHDRNDCLERELDEGTDPSLAVMVHEDHDHCHDQPWAICQHAVCRAAGRVA